jgi:hypothetical protein
MSPNGPPLNLTGHANHIQPIAPQPTPESNRVAATSWRIDPSRCHIHAVPGRRPSDRIHRPGRSRGHHSPRPGPFRGSMCISVGMRV